MLGRGENDRLGLGRMVMMMGQPLQVNQTVEMGGGERFPPPQWSEEETREFIGIRGELERDFKVTKRNKTLWEVVSSKMKERGYTRSPEQCKCKWKNLVNRYKGKETSDPENGRQCPFFDELNAIFTERAKSMQRMLLKSEAGGASQAKKKMRRHGEHSSDEFTEGDDDDDDNSEEERSLIRSRKKKPPPQTAATRTRTTAALDKSRGGSGSSIQEILQDVFQQQQQIEMQWQEAMERRAQERCMFEQEWRQSMEKLETERLVMEQAWREREEQRRMREESRAEKRDALLTTLLDRLIHEDLQ